MRKAAMILCGLLLCLTFVGCGSTDSYMEPTLKIEKSGEITGILVEEFEKDYYDVTELEEMIRLEIAEYNQIKGEERIVLTSIEVSEGEVKVELQYDEYEDYAEYNKVEFFWGTVEDAVEEGINLNHVMVEANGNNTINPQQIREFEDYHLVMWQGDMTVEVPGKIMYHVEDLTLQGSKKIIAEPDLAGPFYLLYK